MTNSELGERGRRKPHILVIPFPTQGHMLPLLDLTQRISSLDAFAITVVTTPKNLPYLSPLLSASPSSVKPLLLPFPAHPLLPAGTENYKDIPIPTTPLFRAFNHALASLRSPLLRWANSPATSSPPDAIISDFFLGWTNGLARDLAIPRVTFSPSSAMTLAVNHHRWAKTNPNPNPNSTDHHTSSSPCIQLSQLSQLKRGYVEGSPITEFIREGFLADVESWGLVFNSFRGLEGPYLDHLKRELGHERVWAVGPVSLLGEPAGERGGPSSVSPAEVMSWLDGRERGSVVYVCFGSQCGLNQEQASVVATALEDSMIHFVWSMKETAVAPEGFEERTKGRGLVIKGWAPQVQVLHHDSVGSFMTHCGWNSVLEAVTTGVTMLLWPMSSDQFYNATLLENERVGIRVYEGNDGVPDLEVLTRVLNDMVRKNGEEKHKKAKELGKVAREAVKEGGSSSRDLDDLVESLKKEIMLCKQ
ncbi:putative UDP-glycosyltransferase 89B1 [Iris pallida]|uniref:UDP-glycosyltransferase 89B1 n=1 Tax=Iris pallida TaxID=29817 RepID=A0AAX6HSP0_IRIPA|nr:putative UDP-glycosyltransferase 89B1 [Iris pallida]KAJ6844086.1 putative UDP-glycosyltransferase 89B1 [Iris pallida]